MIFDGGPARIDAAQVIHEYIGYDGMSLVELKQRGMSEVLKYGAEIRHEVVEAIQRLEDGTFAIRSPNCSLTCRSVVLATGLVDVLPDIAGLPDCWGREVNVCPCFNGYENEGHEPGCLWFA